MARRGPKRRLDVESAYWQLVLSGVGTVEACRIVGIGRKTGYRWWAENGGVPPARLAEGMPSRAIARKLGISRNTVRRALASDGPPRYQRRPRGSIVDAAGAAHRGEPVGDEDEGASSAGEVHELFEGFDFDFGVEGGGRFIADEDGRTWLVASSPNAVTAPWANSEPTTAPTGRPARRSRPRTPETGGPRPKPHADLGELVPRPAGRVADPRPEQRVTGWPRGLLGTGLVRACGGRLGGAVLRRGHVSPCCRVFLSCCGVRVALRGRSVSSVVRRGHRSSSTTPACPGPAG